MITCSNCKAQVPDGTRFCDQCGRPLANAPAPAARPAPPLRPPSFDDSAGKEPPARPPGPGLGPTAAGRAAGAPSVPQPLARPSQPPSPKPGPGAPAGLKLPSLPVMARPAADDSAAAEETGGWPEPPLMPTAPIPEVSVRPRASLALSELQTPYILSSDRAQFLIGREDPVEGVFPDIDLTLSGGMEAGVSRRHALLSYRDGSYWLEDLDSTNYTFVNGIRLEPRRPRSLRDGDELEFGTLRARFYLG